MILRETHMGRRHIFPHQQAALRQRMKYPTILTVNLKHNVVYPGNIVEGFLVVDVPAPTPVAYLQIKIVGKEQIYAANTLNTAVHFKRTLVAHGQAGRVTEAFLQRPPAEDDDSSDDENASQAPPAQPPTGYQPINVAPGRYQYPFRFHLPTNLPSTTCSNQGSATVEVVYYVKAKLIAVEDTFAAEGIGYFDVIRPTPPGHFLTGFNTVNTAPNSTITTCCCMNQGQYKIALTAPQMARLDRDQDFKAQVAVDLHQASVGIANCSLQLHHQFIAHLPTGSFPLGRTIMAQGVTSASTQQLAAGMLHNLNFSVPLQRAMPMTQRGIFFESRYTVEFSFKFDGLFASSTSAAVEAFIRIVPVVDDNGSLRNLMPTNFQPSGDPLWSLQEKRIAHKVVEDPSLPPPQHFVYAYAPPQGHEIPYQPFMQEQAIWALGYDGNRVAPWPGMEGPIPPNSQNAFPDFNWGITFDAMAREEADIPDQAAMDRMIQEILQQGQMHMPPPPEYTE